MFAVLGVAMEDAATDYYECDCTSSAIFVTAVLLVLAVRVGARAEMTKNCDGLAHVFRSASIYEKTDSLTD